MKRLAFIIALLILPMVCNAQLKVLGESDQHDVLSSARMGVVSLDKFGDRYYICSVTTNRFDDQMMFYLGEGKESAMITLRDLIVLCSTIKKKTTTYLDNDGKVIRAYKAAGGLEFHADGFAGYCTFLKSELNRFMYALDPTI